MKYKNITLLHRETHEIIKGETAKEAADKAGVNAASLVNLISTNRFRTGTIHGWRIVTFERVRKA